MSPQTIVGRDPLAGFSGRFDSFKCPIDIPCKKCSLTHHSDLSNGIDTSPSKERGIDKVNKWLDSLPAATNMDIILRDPVWENGWESIVHGM